MKRLIIIIILLSINISVFNQNQDLLNAINNINRDSIKNNVEILEAFGTRFSFADNNKQIAEYLKQRMQDYGFDARIDSFYIQDYEISSDSVSFRGWQYNVTCFNKVNNSEKDSSVFLGAHYDCISNREGFLDYLHYAPGADDNASGCALVLEIARIWNKYIKNQKYNLRIELYDTEEQNLNGSNARMYDICDKKNIFPMAMVNVDMIGYDTSNTVNINYYNKSLTLAQKAKKAVQEYTNLQYSFTQEMIERSDSWPFYSWGFNAVFFTEHDFSPYYHTLQDSSFYLNYNYIYQITKAVTALAYDLSNSEDYIGLDDVYEERFNFYYDNNNLYIRFLQPNSIIDLNIMDMSGQKIISKKSCNNFETISIENLPTGVYLLQICSPNGKNIRKFIH